MAATSASPVVWAFRTLAFGSTAYVSWHLLPILDATPAGHAVALTRAKEPRFALVGVNRIARQAGRGSIYRKNLLQAGVIPALAESAEKGDKEMKEAVGKAVGVLVQEEEAAESILLEDDVVGLLMEGEVAERVWKRILEFENVKGKIREGGLCERVRTAGSKNVLGVLVHGGGC